MGLNTRVVTRLAWGALAALGLWAAADGWRLWQAERLNAALDAGATAAATDAARELRFAHAAALAASGAADEALARYGALQGEDALGRAARFNGANLLLRQAIELRRAGQAGQALALVELAKENYRELLRSRPDDWPARYNLERAQRLVPEPDEADDEPPDTRRNAERAATTMRGYSPGLP